jgi:hypothetical protein
MLLKLRGCCESQKSTFGINFSRSNRRQDPC